jgi:PAS domain S-box-containing protein
MAPADTRGAVIDVRTVLSIALVATAYIVFAEIGFSMAYATKQVTAVWPPTGIAVACLIVLGYRIWPGIFLGAFVSNALSHEPLLTAAAIAVGNTLGPVFGVYLLRRFGRFDPALERVSDVISFVLLASAAGMAVTATNGTLSLVLSGIVPWSAFATTWRLWWTGDAMGVLLFAPVILTWFTPPARFRLAWPAMIETVALGAALIILSALAFLNPFASGYDVYPVLIWAALRFRQRTVASAVVAISAIAIWGSAHGLGPFSEGTLDVRLSGLVTFMAIFAVTGLILGAVIAERRRASSLMQAAERRFRALAQAVPQMVWMADGSGWIDWCNVRWYEYTGQTVDEAAGWGWQRAYHPDDYQQMMRDWPRSIVTGEPFAMESRIRSRDGDYRWFLVRAEPVRDERGSVTRWYGTNTDVDAQKRELQQTTRIADTLQAFFLPGTLPQRQGLRFDALYLTAEKSALVGGDWYDAFEFPDGRIVASIGDVAGHGVGAAMTAARLRQSILTAALDADDPSAILAKVNELLQVQESTVVTALVAVIDRELSTMRFASAGHPPPVIGAPAAGAEILPCSGIPLGVDSDLQLRTHSVRLTPETVVLFYSDGVTEFKRDVLAAEGALLEAVTAIANDGVSPQPALAVQRAVMGANKPTDDAVIMVLQLSPQAAGRAVDSPGARKTWMFHSSDAYFAHAVRHELMTFLRDYGASDEDLSRSELIIGELLANTVKHAPGIVRLEIDCRGNAPVLTIADTGPGLPNFDVRLPDDELNEDGRGLYLIGTLADAVSVDSNDGFGTTMTVALPILRSTHK